MHPRGARVVGILELELPNSEVRPVLVFSDCLTREVALHRASDPAFIMEFDELDIECRGGRLYSSDWPDAWLLRPRHEKEIFVTFSHTGFELVDPSRPGWAAEQAVALLD